MKILLVQGANLTFLGRREPAIYGTTTAAELDAVLQRHANEHGYDLDIFYTNIEGEAINRIYRAVDERFDGLVMNPRWVHLRRLRPQGLHQRRCLALCRGAHQQYRQAQYSLRPLGRLRGLHHRLRDALLRSRSRRDARDFAGTAPGRFDTISRARRRASQRRGRRARLCTSLTVVQLNRAGAKPTDCGRQPPDRTMHSASASVAGWHNRRRGARNGC